MSATPGTGLVDRVYREILGSIMAGEFQEGDKLPTELALTARFTASRPTIREALSRLRADGITSTRQGSGTFVMRAGKAMRSHLENARSRMFGK